MYSCGPIHMDEQMQDDQLEPIYSSSVPIRDVALKTYRKQWTIEKGSERGSRISVLMARYDDDDDSSRSAFFQQYYPLQKNPVTLPERQPSWLELENTPTTSLHRDKIPLHRPMIVLDTTLNNLMTRQQSRSFGVCRECFHCHCFQVHSILAC